MADELLRFIRLVVEGKTDEVRRALESTPSLAVAAARVGAGRGGARPFFFTTIRHYLYAGDTALHIAAAASQRDIAELLLARGADVHARNRMGATPLHYAADANHASPAAQAATIECLLSAGVDPNVVCKRGVTPLHRAVRNRSSSAVRALLDGGADPKKTNRSGSTALFLAQRTTGKSGSGTERAKSEQREIIRLLTEHGALVSS